MTDPHPDNMCSGGPRSRRDQTVGPWRTVAVTPVAGQQTALYQLLDEPGCPTYLQVPVIAWFVQARTTERGRTERVVCAVLDLPTGRIMAVDHPLANRARRLIAVGDPADVRAILDAYPKGSS